MNPTVRSVLDAVESRVGYLRAADTWPDEEGWVRCDRLGPDELAGAVDAGMAARGALDRQVAASLLAQSYAFKVGATSLAAYALGLPWPSPAAVDTAVRLQGGKASGLACLGALGDPDDVDGLGAAFLDRHIDNFLDALRAGSRVGTRLLWGNVAASCAAAFRAVEGAARDRGDTAERAQIRRRAEDFFASARRLEGTGRFEIVEAARRDGWYWTRTSCCLWFRLADAGTCDDCSLIPAAELAGRRRAELEGARR
ncbi:MAG TPA: (2Fe-2S)-binding protein [Acidimicrobiales bacterium]|jgi:hypothetical protein